MQSACKAPAIPLFSQNARHSSVPAQPNTAVARSGAQAPALGQRSEGQPQRWSGSESALTAASTMAALRSLGKVLCIVVLLAASQLLTDNALAERTQPVRHPLSRSTADPLAKVVGEASLRFGVPEHWIRAVMRAESDGEPRTRSKKGAMGLMQIMPGTWTELRSRYHLGVDPYDPHDNILAGTAYIRELHDRYGKPGFLAAYNAGPGRYDRHLATGRPLPDETRAYIATLAPIIDGKQAAGKPVTVASSSARTNSPIFVVRSPSRSTGDRSSNGLDPDRLPGERVAVDLSALVPQSGGLFVHRASEVRPQ